MYFFVDAEGEYYGCFFAFGTGEVVERHLLIGIAWFFYAILPVCSSILCARCPILLALSSAGRALFDRRGVVGAIADLEAAQELPGFWLQPKIAEGKMRELARLTKLRDTWAGLAREQRDIVELAGMTDETHAEDAAALEQAMHAYMDRLHAAELLLYLHGPYDAGDAVLTLHSGAGGLDAADWVSMLLRMYLRFAERKGWRAELLEKSENDGGGIKSATLQIQGEYAYGYLRSEHGTHRLVRRSPFNSAGSRETSFAKVEVLPLVVDDGTLIILPEDLRIDTFAAGGAGGQHVNKTESAVRITHIPTGLVASCQNERSQHQNKEQALQMLRAKLLKLREEEREAAERKMRGEVPRADFGGDAIRSYILDDRRVKDRRTGYEEMNPDKVLDGDLMPFIRAYLEGVAV